MGFMEATLSTLLGFFWNAWCAFWLSAPSSGSLKKVNWERLVTNHTIKHFQNEDNECGSCVKNLRRNNPTGLDGWIQQICHQSVISDSRKRPRKKKKKIINAHVVNVPKENLTHFFEKRQWSITDQFFFPSSDFGEEFMYFYQERFIN